jgi:hypothetical protein
MRDMSMEKVLSTRVGGGESLRQLLESTLTQLVVDGESFSGKDWYHENIWPTFGQLGYSDEDAERLVLAAVRYMCK